MPANCDRDAVCKSIAEEGLSSSPIRAKSKEELWQDELKEKYERFEAIKRADDLSGFRVSDDDFFEKKVKEPNFKKYTSRWPLGPPGSFYNSMGKMICLKDMKTNYLKSTLRWMNKTFDYEVFEYAWEKATEIETELENRGEN